VLADGYQGISSDIEAGYMQTKEDKKKESV
jgi:hypothetical protein